MVLIAPVDDPLASRDEVDPSELRGRTWLLREHGSGTRAFNVEALSRWRLQPRSLTLGSNGAIAEGVRAGLGISIVSRITVALELDAGVLATLPAAGLAQRQWYVHCPGVGPRHPVAEAFVAYAQSRAARETLLATRPNLPGDVSAVAGR